MFIFERREQRLGIGGWFCSVDNTTLNTGTGGDTIASDDIAGVKYQRVKIVEGADGTNDGDISSANPLPVDVSNSASRDLGKVDIANEDNLTASGALGALNATVTISAEGSGTVNWEVDTGTLVGTVVFEATLDDAAWFAIEAMRIAGAIITSTTTFADRGVLTSSGYSQVRVRVSAFTSGTSNARLERSNGTSPVRLGQALPAGTNNIGDVDVLTLPALVAGTANIGDVDIASPLGAGTEAAAVRVTVATDSTGVLSVDDNAGSLTVDNATLSVTGGGVEASALRVTIANDSTGVVSVDDNAGSLTIDGTVTANQGTASSTGWEVVGEVARDVAVAGNPVLMGGRGSSATPTAVSADGDAVDVWCTLSGAVNVADGGSTLSVDDGASSLTVDNATLSVTGGGVEASALRVTLANDSTGVVSVDDNAGSLTVDNAALSVTGGGVEATAQRVTIANDSTGLLSVDDNGGSLTIDGSVGLNAGANNIGDVDVLTTVNPANRTASGALGALNAAVTINSEGTGTVHWEIDTGTLVGTVVFEATLDDTNWFAVHAIRIDGTVISSTTTFADRGALTSSGYSQVRLRVSSFTSGTSNARTEASAGAAVVRLGQMLPSGANNIGDVDVISVPAPLNVTGGGTEAAALRVTIASDSTGVLSVDDNAGSLTVDGTVTANAGTGTFTVSGTVTANIGTSGSLALDATLTNQQITDNAAFTDGTTKVAMAGYIFDDVAGTALTENDAAAGRVNANRALVSTIEDGVTRARYATVTAANALKVDGSAVTQPVSGTVTANAGTGTFTVGGVVAHDAAVSGNPNLVAVRANANEPAVVADGDATHLWADLFGRLVVLPGHPSPEAPVTANGSAAGVSVIAAPGASLSLYICKGSVHNSAATEAIVSLRDGAAGTIRWTANLAADGGGSLFDFGARGWKLTANTAFVMDAVSATQYCNVTEYYIAA